MKSWRDDEVNEQSHRELQNNCNMSPWHDPMYSCIDATSQWKHCKAVSRHPAVITLWFFTTVWHGFSYLPSSSYSWLLREARLFHIVCLFPSFFFNPLFSIYKNFFLPRSIFSYPCLFVHKFIMSRSIEAAAEILLSDHTPQKKSVIKS